MPAAAARFKTCGANYPSPSQKAGALTCGANYPHQATKRYKRGAVLYFFGEQELDLT